MYNLDIEKRVNKVTNYKHMINYIKRNYLKLIFIILEAVMFCLIFNNDLAVNVTSYVSICICLLFTIISFDNTFDRLLVTLGLTFTVGADTFLVLMSNGNKIIAMCLFITVQTIYLIRLITIEKSNKLRIVNLSSSALLILIALASTFIVLLERTDALSLLSIIYFAMLISNVIFALISFKTLPLFGIGLILFAICDFLVGLDFLYIYINIPDNSIIDRIISVPINLAWIFYLPSQVLIALSCKRNILADTKT